MKYAGVAECAETAWTLSIVFVIEKDKSNCFCVDYRRLNAVTVCDSNLIHRMDVCIDSLRRAKLFSTSDGNSGYQ